MVIFDCFSTNYLVAVLQLILLPYFCLTGISIDWATKKGVPFVYCMELRDDGKLGFILPASEIIPTGKEGFELIKAVADAIGKPQSRL